MFHFIKSTNIIGVDFYYYVKLSAEAEMDNTLFLTGMALWSEHVVCLVTFTLGKSEARC